MITIPFFFSNYLERIGVKICDCFFWQIKTVLYPQCKSLIRSFALHLPYSTLGSSLVLEEEDSDDEDSDDSDHDNHSNA